MQSHYDEMRDRVRVLDATLAKNRELEQQLASLKKDFQALKEVNINRQEYAAKEEAKKQAYLENREKIEGTPTTAKIGFWEFAANIGAINRNNANYLEEKNRRLDKHGS